MMRKIILIAFFTSALVLSARALYAQFNPAGPLQNPNGLVVAELFTSQSCSSCPPADKLFVEIVELDNVIAFSCHVTYWDHLRWKDTLSQDFCTDRQRYYANYRNGRTYTPQTVINGVSEFVGSDRLKTAIALQQFGQRPLQEIGLKLSTENKLEISLPALESSAGNDHAVWIFGVKDLHVQEIPSGENRGRTVTYRNSAVFQDKLPLWKGEARQTRITLPDNAEMDRIIILGQIEGFGRILAAGQLNLR